jgi:hypothetical protein
MRGCLVLEVVIVVEERGSELDWLFGVGDSENCSSCDVVEGFYPDEKEQRPTSDEEAG